MSQGIHLDANDGVLVYLDDISSYSIDTIITYCIRDIQPHYHNLGSIQLPGGIIILAVTN
jgi:hypothetical protein